MVPPPDMRSLDRIATVDDLRALAARRLPRPVFDFIEGAAFRERTCARNVDDLADIRFRQRVLVDVRDRSIATRMLGQAVTMPVAIAPTGLSGALSGDGRGEIHAARAAQRAGVPYTLGMLSQSSLEEVTDATVPPWFQLCILSDRAIVRDLIDRAIQVECPVLVVTLTWPVVSRMNRRITNPFARFPPSLKPESIAQYAARPAWSLRALFARPPKYRNFERYPASNISPMGPVGLLDPGLGWDDIAWLRDLWPHKLVLKGITNAEEADHAVAIGADGVIVSNHGGNVLDEADSTIRRLPEVVAAAGNRLEVLMDGGVRSGQDVLKAMALGARGCLLGRAHLYGLGAAKEAGVAKALEIIRTELEITAALVGLRDLDHVSSDILCAGPIRSY